MHVLDLNGACYLLSVKCNVNVKSDVKKKNKRLGIGSGMCARVMCRRQTSKVSF